MLFDTLFLLRHYFAITTNPGEQFYAFTSVTAWVLSQCGVSFERPQEVNRPLLIIIPGYSRTINYKIRYREPNVLYDNTILYYALICILIFSKFQLISLQFGGTLDEEVSFVNLIFCS